MQDNKDVATDFDKAYTTFYRKEVKTVDPLETQRSKAKFSNDKIKNYTRWCSCFAPVVSHYFTLTLVGLLTWVALWCLWGDNWSWNGQWFKLAAIAIIAWASGQLLQTLTMLPPLLAALLTGILARNLDILNMNDYTQIDIFLRKLYPIAILGKGALGWDLKFMKSNWKQVASLGALPWLAEVCVLAFCVHYFVGFPLVWGFLLGSIYASVSFAVIMPPVVRISSQACSKRNWPQLICTAGGVDTALSVSVYGILFSVIFYESSDNYRYAKAGLTLFAGVGLGVVMGCIAGLIPHKDDMYVTELRILLVMIGGLVAHIFTAMFGWVGTGGVAILVCNSTAATFWARDGWKLNNNPASTAYRVVWSTLEPILFAYTGTFFEVGSMSKLLLPGFAILAVCLFVRLSVACLACWNFSFKEKLFVCCAWTPKSIVEAVLCPLALDTLIAAGGQNRPEKEYAENLMRLIIQAILVTTPIGFFLTNYLGPYLLKQPELDCEKADRMSQHRKSSASQPEARI